MIVNLMKFLNLISLNGYTINKNMDKLVELGWKFRYDIFETYWKQIHNYEIIVSKHIKYEKAFTCTLVKYEGGNDEITISHDCSFEWVKKIEDLLSTTIFF